MGASSSAVRGCRGLRVRHRGMRPSSRLLLVLVAAAALTCAFANDSVESMEAPVESSKAEAKMVKRAIELKTLRVEEAQAKRSKARNMLRKAGKAIPAGLEKGSLLKMMNRKNQEAVVKEVTKLTDQPLQDTEHSAKGRKARIIAARMSRAKARKVLKKNKRHIPYILQKGNLDKVTKMADKGVLIHHIQNSEAFRSNDAEENKILELAGADTVSAILDMVPPQPGQTEDSEAVKYAKKMRAEARAAMKAEGRRIPYVLRVGTLKRLMRIKDRRTVLAHLHGLRAKNALRQKAKRKADHFKAIQKQRADARKELRSQGREIPYVLQKNTLKVMMGLKGAERDEVLKHVEEASKEVKEVDKEVAAHKAKQAAANKATAEQKKEWLALKTLRAKARKELKANGKPVPFFLAKNSMAAIGRLHSSEKKEVQAQMRKVEAQIRADKNHKAYSDPAAEKKAEAKEQALEDEEEAMRAQKAMDDPRADKSALKEAIADAKAEPRASGDPLKDAVRAASHASVGALRGVLPKNHAAQLALDQKKEKAPKAPTINGCSPKDPNMEYLGAMSQQLSALAEEVDEVAKDPKEKITTKVIEDGNNLRKHLADMFAEACRDVPIVVHGEGIDDIKQVATVAKKFFNYQKTDLKLRAKRDLKTRVQNEMKRGAASCTAKNEHMSDSATVIDCNNRVWARIQYMLEEYEAGPGPK